MIVFKLTTLTFSDHWDCTLSFSFSISFNGLSMLPSPSIQLPTELLKELFEDLLVHAFSTVQVKSYSFMLKAGIPKEKRIVATVNHTLKFHESSCQETLHHLQPQLSL